MADYGEADLDRQFVMDAYNDFELTGNFVPMYCDMVDTDFMIEIESRVRNFILKKYPIRKKKENIKQEEDNNENQEETNNDENN